jgi:cell division protein FtsQ
MRLLKKASRKTAARRRPRQATRLRARHLAAALIVLSVSAAAGTIAFAWRAGHVDAAVATLRQASIDATAGIGLVVQEVLVEGRGRTDQSDLLEAVGVDRGDAMLTLDLEAMRERVESLPWVRVAVVERRLPGIVLVRLEERRPYALWQRDGVHELIDENGAVIARQDVRRYRNLPVVVGDQAPEQARTIIDQLSREPTLAGRVRALTWVGNRRWNIRMDNGISVELPERDPAGAWSRLADIEKTHGILSRDVTAIDLRLDGRLIVRMAPDGVVRARTPGKET